MDAIKVGAFVPVSLELLLDAGDRSPATLRAAERSGQWWSIGRHYNPFPTLHLTPRLDRAADWCTEARRRIDGAIDVLRFGADSEVW